MSLINLLLPEFDQEMAKTRTVLERCPEDKFTWKPHPKSWDVATLATHITNLPGWSVEVISKDSLDIAPPGSPPYKAEPASSPQDLLERLGKNIAAGRAAIGGASDERLMQSWSLLSGGHVIFTLPRIAVLRSMVMNHCIHHRAQLGIYLRLLGIAVPGIYGPSADEGGM